MEEDIKPIEYKFILLGDSSVGKSSIYRRLLWKKFSEESLTTLGTEKTIVNFDDVEVNENEKINKNFRITLSHYKIHEKYK